MVFVSCRPLELGCFIQARGDAGDLGDVLHSLAPGMFSPVPLRQSLGTILARQGLRDALGILGVAQPWSQSTRFYLAWEDAMARRP